MLWIATKSPFPATDGGRLVTSVTVEALAQAGADVTILSPDAASGTPASTGVSHTALAGVRLETVPARPESWSRAAWRSLRSGRPLSIERHASAAMAARVAALDPCAAFDLVHIEQPQALAGAAPAIDAGLPAVLRAQNVESDVWRAAAESSRWRAPLFALEARRFRRFEAEALSRVDATIALSPHDAQQLAALNPSAPIFTVAPPFAAASPIGTSPDDVYRHDVYRRSADVTSVAPSGPSSFTRSTFTPSSFTWIGSHGWLVNRDAVRWLEADIWPAIAARLPQARLRLFGGAAHDGQGSSADLHDGASSVADAIDAPRAATIDRLPSPADCAEAFTPDTILLLPLRRILGIRMRLLDAWARGVPVIATPAAAAGLAAEDGRNVLLASTPRAFAEAAARLAADPALRATLVAGGRATLARDHDPAAIARAMLAVYAEAIARHRTRR